jgi:uncharacterized membrane protein
MDFGKGIQQSIDLYLQNFGILLAATLLVGLLSCLTFGILAGPLCGGLLVLGLKILRNEKPEFKEIFAHFDQFVPTLIISLLLWVVGLALSHIPAIGWLLVLVLGPAGYGIYALAIGLVVDRKTDPLSALRLGLDCLGRQLLPLWLFGLVISILSWLGAALCFIPVILTMPVGAAGMAVLYHELSPGIPMALPPKDRT